MVREVPSEVRPFIATPLGEGPAIRSDHSFTMTKSDQSNGPVKLVSDGSVRQYLNREIVKLRTGVCRKMLSVPANISLRLASNTSLLVAMLKLSRVTSVVKS